jgi:outer membrane protein TolC
LLGARAQIRGAEATARAIGAELRPDLSLSATFSARAGTATPTSGPLSPDYGPLPTVPNWDVGLVLRWPLYDAVVTARRNAAASRIEVARTDAAVLGRQETAAVQQAYVGLEIAGAALAGLERAVEAAHANYAQAEARFKAGLGTSLELADAEAVRTDAEIQLAVGRFDAQRARAVLARLLAETTS